MDAALKKKWHEMAVRELSTHCQLGQAAFQSVGEGVARGSTDIVFSSMHAFLSHTGNVSKILRAREEPTALEHFAQMFRWFPRFARFLTKLDRILPRRTIGDLVGVGGAKVVHKEARKFRNNLEHYDEGLIRWLRRTGPNVNIMDFNVMPKEAVQFGKGAKAIFVRNLNPKTNVFTLTDKDLSVPVVVEELQRIQSVAGKWLHANGYR